MLGGLCLLPELRMFLFGDPAFGTYLAPQCDRRTGQYKLVLTADTLNPKPGSLLDANLHFCHK